MKLSYIVPVYNVEKYLRQCIDSILYQSMDDYEIILIDDGSPDGCPAICDEYKEKYPEIFVIIHKKNEGPACARNVGIETARGDYLFFVDSDDYLISDRVQELYDTACKYNADIVQNSYYSLTENNGEILKTENTIECGRLLKHSDMEKEICLQASKRLIVFMWRNLYRRRFIIDKNLRLDETLRMVEDPPFNMQAFCSADRFVEVDIPVYCYRLRDDSLQRKKYVPDYDEVLYYQWALKLRYYEELCTPSKLFYEDIAEYTVKSIMPTLLRNVYINNIEERFSILKRIGNSEMMRKSFKDYDINRFRSKSLDWLMTYFIKKKLYFFAHILCERVLYK